MTSRANELARQILAEHEVPPLPEAAERVIAEALAERANG
jgi:trimethylamine:corrinoid methyltransferase-like protein